MNAITKIDADKLNVLELAIVFTVVAVVMLLFVGSFLISVLINRNLNKMQALREGGVSVARDSMPQAEIVAHGEDTAGIPSPDEVFGKKQD